MTVGSNLQKIRAIKGYSQEYMAEELGMTQSNYSKLESDGGKITMKMLEKAANILEVDPMDILAFDEKYIFNIHNPKDNSSAGLVINHFSQKMQDLYEARIKSLEDQIRGMENEVAFLRSLLSEKKN